MRLFQLNELFLYPFGLELIYFGQLLEVTLFLGFEEVDERVGLFSLQMLLVFVPVYLGDYSELLLIHVSQVIFVSESLPASLQLLNYRVLLLE